MRRSDSFLMRQVAGSCVVVPVGNAVRTFPGMIRLNVSGQYLWELLAREQSTDSLAQALQEHYEVSSEQARQDVDVFLERLRSAGALTE